MVDYQALSIVFAGLSIAVSIVYYASVLRNQNKVRQTQMFMQLHEAKYDREGLDAFFKMQFREWKDFDDYMEKYGPRDHPEESAMYESQISYLEGLGILVQEGMVDINIVNKIAGRRILQHWQKFEQVIKDLRMMAPLGPGHDYCESFEFLANEILKIRKREGLPLYEDRIHPTSQQYQKYNP